jgi:hypothetical protein
LRAAFATGTLFTTPGFTVYIAWGATATDGFTAGFIEIALPFWAEPTGFAAAGFALAEFIATALSFGVAVGLAAARTDTAVTFGASFAVLTLVPLGDGLPACVEMLAGFTLIVAGFAAGVCTAVGVCANAAADRSMSVPRFRII